METHYKYWYIEYESCEGNYRHYIARSPLIWEKYDVENAITMGGMGDDPAEIISIEETNYPLNSSKFEVFKIRVESLDIKDILLIFGITNTPNYEDCTIQIFQRKD